MTTLSSRLAAAVAGSRDLDRELAVALGWRREPRATDAGYPPGDNMPGARFPSFTTDLATIAAEIERRGMLWSSWNNADEFTDVWRAGDYENRGEVRSRPEVALALCAALARALGGVD